MSELVQLGGDEFVSVAGEVERNQDSGVEVSARVLFVALGPDSDFGRSVLDRVHEVAFESFYDGIHFSDPLSFGLNLESSLNPD